MKKYAYLWIGILVGIAFGVSFGIIGDLLSGSSGKKIENEVEVIVDGSKLGTAIVVDGKSFVPVRNMAEAAGYTIHLQEKKIVLVKKPSRQMYLEGIRMADKRIRELENSRQFVEKVLEDMKENPRYTVEEIKMFKAKFESFHYDLAKLKKYKAEAEQRLLELDQ